MLFNIYTTSGSSSSTKPCQNAIDVTSKEYPSFKQWQVEINTLEELLALKKEVDEELVLTNSWRDYSLEIEIYDDYRE